MKTIKITNMKYDGHDFCGDFSLEDMYKIISEQPTELSISISDKTIEEYISFGSGYNEIVCDWCYENGILEPTSFDFNLAN
jgi:hypothetical protein